MLTITTAERDARWTEYIVVNISDDSTGQADSRAESVMGIGFAVDRVVITRTGPSQDTFDRLDVEVNGFSPYTGVVGRDYTVDLIDGTDNISRHAPKWLRGVIYDAIGGKNSPFTKSTWKPKP